MAIKCCHKCVAPERYPGCHAVCPKYIAENEKHQAERQAIRKYLDTQDGICSQQRASVYRTSKSHGKKGRV